MSGTSVTELAIGYEDVAAAARRLAGVANRTPVMTSRTFNARVGAQVWFKCENFQRVGAFKFRGAFNAIAQLSEQQRARGVITYSSGNHGQAVALAARLLGTKAVVVMPEDAPAVKVDAVKGYGGEALLYDPAHEQRELIAQRIARERELEIIPPFDHPHIMAGQGTSAHELIEEVGALDYLLVPVGGGGLISGCAVAASALSPACKVVGVEPAAGDDGVRSFRSKTLQRIGTPNTIADGARTACLGNLTFPVILRRVHDMVSVPDSALVTTLQFFAQRMKIVVEPTGALAAAALLTGVVQAPSARVGVIISGGNVDAAQLAAYLTA